MKTSILLKISLGLLLTIIVVVGVMEILEKEKLKRCIQRQSFRCPRFTCPGKDDTSDGGCGARPYICPDGDDKCDENKICIGYCNQN